MKLLPAQKKHALSRGLLGCLGEVATLNLTRGCAGECLFCYARCVPGAPQPGNLHIYHELPEQLERQLDRRRRPPPAFVIVGTACDPFLGGPEVENLTHRCIKLLLERHIGLSISTRGIIPDEVVTLLARHAEHVQLTLPVTSMDEDYTSTWEPGTAAARQRIFQLQRLKKAGLSFYPRMEPLIPFVNDDSEPIKETLSALSGLGIRQTVLSFMHLRPGVAEQLERESPGLAPLVLGGFTPDPQFQPAAAKFRHLPLRHRTAALKRVQRIGDDLGVRVTACRCQNPGISSARCPVQPPELPEPPAEQLSLIK